MQRYFIENTIDDIELLPSDLHHLLIVMRAKVGDKIEVVDVNQSVHVVKVAEIRSKSEVYFTIIHEVEDYSEMPIQVTIATGLSKNDKLDWIVQKATELGMSYFQPLALKRDVVIWKQQKRIDKIQRLQKIANAAAEQSKRRVRPIVGDLLKLEDFVDTYQDYDLKLIAYEEEAKVHNHQILKELITSLGQNGKCICVFGSEGGLDPKEVLILQEKGFIPVSLGPRILRAETAPMYLLSALSYAFELN